MRRPAARGTPVDDGRFAGWLERFAGYRVQATRARIEQWLARFDAGDRDLSARILDAVEFFRLDQQSDAFRAILGALPGWSRNAARRQGRWRFVAFGIHSGESGDAMLAAFRVANGLDGARFNELFIHKADLLRENLEPKDTVVFVDDFAGTGNQVTEAWSESLRELLPGGPRTFLVLVVAVEDARQRIGRETPLVVRAFRYLRAQDNLFAHECNHFSRPEKNTALNYCQRADALNPRGYGECGLLLVFSHRCPNNSLPILHARGRRFEGLFPR